MVVYCEAMSLPLVTISTCSFYPLLCREVHTIIRIFRGKWFIGHSSFGVSVGGVGSRSFCASILDSTRILISFLCLLSVYGASPEGRLSISHDSLYSISTFFGVALCSVTSIPWSKKSIDSVYSWFLVVKIEVMIVKLFAYWCGNWKPQISLSTSREKVYWLGLNNQIEPLKERPDSHWEFRWLPCGLCHCRFYEVNSLQAGTLHDLSELSLLPCVFRREPWDLEGTQSGWDFDKSLMRILGNDSYVQTSNPLTLQDNKCDYLSH